MVTPQSSTTTWVIIFTTLALISLFAAIGSADNLQVNVRSDTLNGGSEGNVSQTIVQTIVVTSNDSTSNLTNLNLTVTFNPAFMRVTGANPAPTDQGANFIHVNESGGAAINLTNGSASEFTFQFAAQRNAKDLNITIKVNGIAADIGTDSENSTVLSYNISSVVFFGNYSALSTNFTSMFLNILSLSSVAGGTSGPLLSNANGSISWINKINLSNSSLDQQTIIGTGFLGFNTSYFDPSVNGSAFLKFFNVTCANTLPLIFYDGNVTDSTELYKGHGRDCLRSGECYNITCADSILSFTVLHFSGYSAYANAVLVSNSSNAPGRTTGTGVPINFTAVYTNGTNNEVVNGTCELNFTQGYGALLSANMSQQVYTVAAGVDMAIYLFNWTPNRTQEGYYSYNITCDNPDFAMLGGNGTFNVTDNVAPQVLNLSPIGNMTFNQTVVSGSDGVINITAYVVEESGGVGIDKVYINITNTTSGVENYLMTNESNVFNFTYFGMSSLGRFSLPFGWYTYRIIANDTVGNVNSTTNGSFFVNDTIAPLVTNMSPNNANISLWATVNLSVNVSDKFYLPGGVYELPGSGVQTVLINVTLPVTLETITITALASGVADIYIANFSNTSQGGRYNWQVLANDSYNNVNTTMSAFFVGNDTVAPSVSNITPSGNQTFNQVDVINITAMVEDNIGGTGIDKVLVNITFPNASSAMYTMTNGSAFLFNFSFNETALHIWGRYNITIWANDTSTNLNYTVNASFFVNDSIAPKVTNLSPNNINFSMFEMVNFSLNVSDVDRGNAGSGINTLYLNITLPVSLTSVIITPVASGVADIYIINFSNTSQGGRYNWTVYVNDSYNNINATVGAFYIVNDTISPSVANLSPSGNATFNQTSAINLTAYVYENVGGTGIDKVYVNITYPNATSRQFFMTNDTFVFNYTFDETLPHVFGTYNYTIQANDTSGHLNYSVNASFFINDTTAPSLANMSPNGKSIDPNAMLNLSVNTSDIGGSGVKNVTFNVTLPENGVVITIQAFPSGVNNIYIANFSNTSQKGTYNWVAESNDSYNNRGALAGTFLMLSSVKNSTIASDVNYTNTTFENSTAKNSVIDNTIVNASQVQNATLSNSSIMEGVINLTTMGNTTVFNSTMLGAVVNDSQVWNTSLYNTTALYSIINSTYMKNSTVEFSNVTGGSVNNSKIENATVLLSIVRDSRINRSVVDPSTITNSTVDVNSNVTDSTVTNSTVFASNVTNAIVNNSLVNTTWMVYANVTGTSTVIRSNLTTSQAISSWLRDANLTLAYVFNSTLNGTTILNGNISNSKLINVSTFENATMTGGTIQDALVVNDLVAVFALNTTTESPINVSRPVGMRLVVNTTMAQRIDNLTVVILYNGKYLNYSTSTPGSQANASNLTAQILGYAENFTSATAFGNTIASPLTAGRYSELNFTFTALGNHTNTTVLFNVTLTRIDGTVRQFNVTVNSSIIAVIASQADFTAAGFSPNENNMTTNLSLVPDVSNVAGFQLSNKNGTVNWTLPIAAYASTGGPLPMAGRPLEMGAGPIDLADNHAGFLVFNASAFHPSFNQSAKITFYNVSCPSNPVPVVVQNDSIQQTAIDIASNGRDCLSAGACQDITCTAGSDGRGNLTFTAKHFSAFTSSGNANLTIYNDASYSGTYTTYTAKYVNASNGALITGATCNMSVTDDVSRSYNMTQGTSNYTFAQTPSSQGAFTYNVTCVHPAFTTINSYVNIIYYGAPGVGWSGGGGGGYSRRASTDMSQTNTNAPGTTVATNAPTSTSAPTKMTSFQLLDVIKAYYKGAKDYTAFQIIDLIKRFYSGK